MIDDGLKETFRKLGIDPDNLPDDAPKVPPKQVANFLRQVGNILNQAESYRALPSDQQAKILANTRRIADVLAEPADLTPAKPADLTPAKSPTPADDPFAIRF